jgi:2-phospho-L-lactate guanylyltransferase (CobY/MobA/RfbA family)
MARVVVPFREQGAKSRLGFGSEAARRAVVLAMLDDVLATAAAVGTTVVATGDGGQGRAVAAELERLPEEPVLVVNADLPCATPRDLLALLGTAPPGGIALVEASDGTTNVLALASPRQFASLYGPGSGARFRAHAARLGVDCVAVEIPNLADDVDTAEDLERLEGRLGRRTSAVLASFRVGAAT